MTHGIMFHHFHDFERHIKCDGSIDSDDFEKLLDYYSKSHNIISADDYIKKLKSNTLRDSDVCLTFDDGLLCQYDVALPVLRKKGIINSEESLSLLNSL